MEVLVHPLSSLYYTKNPSLKDLNLAKRVSPSMILV